MPRPKKPRFVSKYPIIASFVPQGVHISGEVFLSVEELEAIRLSDFERLDQETAANLMQVSRQTYGRILANARGIVGDALVTGKTLRVEGGTYEMRDRRRHRGRRWRNDMPTLDKNQRKGVNEMPKGDGTGPQGQGSKFGRGRGRRNPNGDESTSKKRGDIGSGRGTGRGQSQSLGRGSGKGGRKRNNQNV